MAASSILRKLTIPPTRSCTGSVIFLHGSGGTGVITKQMIKFSLDEDLEFPHLQIHYPTAPLRRYSLNGGFHQNVWFDRMTLEESAEEDLEGIENMATRLNRLIDDDIEAGIPISRILVGGFSMGGAMALHLGLRFRRNLAGVFCLSSFLSTESKVYEDLRSHTGSLPPVFMAHGEDDDMVPLKWSKNTHATLVKMGVNCIFHSYPNICHEHSKEELNTFKDWVFDRIPFHTLP